MRICREVGERLAASAGRCTTSLLVVVSKEQNTLPPARRRSRCEHPAERALLPSAQGRWAALDGRDARREIKAGPGLDVLSQVSVAGPRLYQ